MRRYDQFDITKGILVRIIFAFHIGLAVWRLTDITNDINFWAILSAIWFLILEGALTLGLNKGGEWRWFNPCIFIYLAGIVPCVVFLEYDLLQTRLQLQEFTSTSFDKLDDSSCMHVSRNATSIFNIPGIAVIPITLSVSNWSVAMQQTLLFLLIMGRWLLPKGKLSRQNLTVLLLTHIAMAADILEFLSQGVEAEEVACERTMILIILGVWSWSLLQFTLPASLSSKRLYGSTEDLERRNQSCGGRFKQLEEWSIISILFLQDAPFLVIRMYLIVMYNIVDQSLLFFTAKNILMILLQMYHMWILLCLPEETDKGQYSLDQEPQLKSYIEAEMAESSMITNTNHVQPPSTHLNNGFISDVKHSPQMQREHGEESSPVVTRITVEADVERQPSPKSRHQLPKANGELPTIKNEKEAVDDEHQLNEYESVA